MATATANTLSWGNISTVGVDSHDTSQIAYNVLTPSSVGSGSVQAVVVLCTERYQFFSTMASMVGIVQPDGTVQWGQVSGVDRADQESERFATLALSQAGTALSFHVSSGLTSTELWGNLGVINVASKSIPQWTSFDAQDQGYEPSVGLNSGPWLTGYFVLVHRTDSITHRDRLYYRIGQLIESAAAPTVTWKAKQDSFGKGFLTSIALYNDIAVLVSQTKSSFSDLQIRLGQVDSAGTVTFQDPKTYAQGNRASVCILPGGQIVEMHEALDPNLTQASYLATNIFSYSSSPNLQLGPMPAHRNVAAGYGVAPSVSASATGGNLVFSCLDANNVFGGGEPVTHHNLLPVYCATGSLSTVTYGLPESLLPRRYNTITFAGTHNSYSNPYDGDGPFGIKSYPALNRNNSLSIAQQLDMGIRCLDIEVHTAKDPRPNNHDILVYHGTNIVLGGEFCYSYLNKPVRQDQELD